jgi:hypothetical protein
LSAAEHTLHGPVHTLARPDLDADIAADFPGSHDRAVPPGLWSTSAFGLDAAPSHGELRLLGDHLATCRHGAPATALHCGVHAARGFIATHLVTCAALLAVAATLFWLSV